MERLTKVDGIDQNEIIKCFGCGLENTGAELEHCGYCKHWQAVVDRLAAYEDTGLEPEQIIGLCKMDRRAKMADLLRLEEYHSLGPIDELSALVKAQNKGRVLPDKSMWTTTCDGRKLVLVMDVRAAQDGEAALGGCGDG